MFYRIISKDPDYGELIRSPIPAADLEELQKETIKNGYTLLSVLPVPWPEVYSCNDILPMADGLGIGYVTLIDAMGDDLEPLRSARMSTSNPTGVDSTKDDGLRTRLWGDRHTSPFEACYMEVEMEIPIFGLRQLDRHRTVHVSDMKIEVVDDYDQFRVWTNRNEFSGRYSEMPDRFWIPPVQRFRASGSANKQGSALSLPSSVQESAEALVQVVTKECRAAYEQLKQWGVSNEIARIVLPPNQMTKIRISGCLLHWLKLLDLRLRKDVQEETRLYAEAIAGAVRLLWPKCYEVFVEFNLEGIQLTASERDAIFSAVNIDELYEKLPKAAVDKLMKKLARQ